MFYVYIQLNLLRPSSFSYLYENVISVKIRGGELVSELQSLAKRVSDIAQQQLKDEEALVDAPEDFLDPIMSTIMYDPVILPSSKITTDRTTIARFVCCWTHFIFRRLN